jgi:quinol monooxygenase YgiN
MAVVLVARWVARQGEEERVLAALEQLAPASRVESGCLYYQPCRDRDDPTRFLIFEVYADEEAVQAHGESEHFRRLVLGEAVPLLESRERTFYDTID